jgi:hypothetical protein
MPTSNINDDGATPVSWLWLAGLLALHCLLAVLLMQAVPPGAAPDEAAHIEYVQYLLNHGSAPVFKALGAGHAGYEFHQPPLYYAVCAALAHLGGHDAAVPALLCRMVSLCFSLGTVLLVWLSAVCLFARRNSVVILATGLTALLPLQVAVAAGAGNDSAAGFFCAVLFWCMARAARYEGAGAGSAALRNAVTAGVAMGLGMLSKSTCLAVAAVALPALVYYACRSEKTTTSALRAAVRVVGLAIIVALAICGWWLLRNLRLYGDPLAAQAFEQAFRNSSPSPSDFMNDGRLFAHGVSFLTYVRALLLTLFCTTWGFFGGPNTALTVLNPFGRGGPRPEIIAALLPMTACAAVTTVALLGCVRGALQLRCATSGKRSALLWWAAGATLVCAAWLRFNFFSFQGQARYLEPALLPLVLFAALGWRYSIVQRWGERKSNVLAAAFGLLMAGLTLWNVCVWHTLV